MSSEQSTKLSLKEEIARALGIEKSSKGQLFDRDIIKELHKYESVFAEIREAKKLASEQNVQVDTEKLVSTVKKSIAAISQYELPPELVKVEKSSEGKTVVLSRVSSVLSQNKIKQATKFAEGTVNLLRSLEKGDKLLFEAIKGKDKVATQLFRNPFSYTIVSTIVETMDKGVNVFIVNKDTSLSFVDYPKLIFLYAKGIQTSVLERTEVYDGLFSTEYSRSHYNQFLQWSFGFARRDPQIEFKSLLNKYDKLAVDLNDIDKRAEEAIKLLKKKKELFGLSNVGLGTAISKILKFNSLLKQFAEHKKQIKAEKIYKIKATASEVAKVAKELSAEELKALVAELNSSLLE